MKPSILVILGLIVLVLAGIGVVIFLNTRTTPSTETPETPAVVFPDSTVSVSNDQSKQAVQAAYLAEVAKHPGDNIKLFGTSIAGDYALQLWVGDTTGGQALLKYDAVRRKWVLLDGGGGEWSVETLVSVMGVPQGTAEKLLAGLPK